MSNVAGCTCYVNYEGGGGATLYNAHCPVHSPSSTTANSVGLPNPDPVELRESDRQSSESAVFIAGEHPVAYKEEHLGSASALEVDAARTEAENYLALGEFAAWDGDDGPRTLEHFEAEFERLLTTIGPKNTSFVMASLERGRIMAQHILGLCELLASATKPEASPSPENDQERILYTVRIYRTGGEVMRKFREYGEPGETTQETADRIFNEVADDSRIGTVEIWAEDRKSEWAQSHRSASTTTAEPSPIPDSSRPVSTDEEEGQ